VEVHVPWINGSSVFFPPPNPEEESKERKWEIITIEKRSRFGVEPHET